MRKIMPATLQSKMATTAFAMWPTFSDNRNAGLSTQASLAKAAVAGFFEYSMPGAYYAYELAPLVVTGIKGAYDFRHNKKSEIQGRKEDHGKGLVGGGYTDTKHAHAMRMAGVQQIQNNKLNSRSALGGESRLITIRKKEF